MLQRTRDTAMTIRLSKKEKEMIREHASMHGLSVTEYILFLVNGLYNPIFDRMNILLSKVTETERYILSVDKKSMNKTDAYNLMKIKEVQKEIRNLLLKFTGEDINYEYNSKNC